MAGEESVLTADDWGLILEGIARKQCVPFLGAGVNVGRDGYKGLPLASEVTARLVEVLVKKQVASIDDLVKVEADEALADYSDLARVRIHDLSRVALHVEQKLMETPRLYERLRTIIDDINCEPSRILTTLAGLPFRLIVTANYDRLMEAALTTANRPFEVVVQPPKGFFSAVNEEQERGLETLSGTILYKIHGTFDAADPPSQVVLTEDDYIEFLTVALDSERGVPPLIRRLMKTSTLLFLGYGLEDWDFRTIHKGLIQRLERHEKKRAYAIQFEPPPFWTSFWREWGVHIIEMDIYAFADELASRWDAYQAGG